MEGTRGRRRRWAVLPVLLTLAAVGAACGGDDEDAATTAAAPAATSEAATGEAVTSGTEVATSSAEATTAAAEEELSGTVTVWHYYDEGAGGLFPLIDTWKKNFEAAHPDVTVEFQYQPYDQMTSKVTAAAAAGKGPDIVMPAGPFLPEMVKAGAIEPIDSYWDAYADKGLFPAPTQDNNIIDGKRMATQFYTNVVGVYYNTKILTEIGAEPPTSVAEMEAAMEKAKAAGYTGFTTSAATGAGGEFFLVPWLLGTGWTYDNAAAPEALGILQTLEGWRDKGYLSKNDAAGFTATPNFATGKYLFAQEGNWNLSTVDKAGVDYGIAVFPGVDRAVIGGELVALGANSKNKDLAWAFVQETYLSKQGGLDAVTAGSIPLRSDLAEEPSVTENEKLADFTKIASGSVPTPLVKGAGKVSASIGDAFNQLVAGKFTAQQAAEQIAEQVPPLIEAG